MKKLIAILSAIAMSVALSHAQTVEERMDALEKKVDRILEILEDQKRRTKDEHPAPPHGTKKLDKKEEGKAAPSGKGMPEMQKGTMLSAYRVTKATYATPQAENPVVLKFLDATDEFKIANFLNSPTGKLFDKNQIGVKWEGYLSIREPGTYEFAASSPAHTSAVHQAVGKLAVEGQNVVSQTTYSKETALGTIKLEGVGMFSIEVWVSPLRPEQVHHKLEFQYRKQGDTTFQKITPGSLYCLKEK